MEFDLITGVDDDKSNTLRENKFLIIEQSKRSHSPFDLVSIYEPSTFATIKRLQCIKYQISSQKYLIIDK